MKRLLQQVIFAGLVAFPVRGVAQGCSLCNTQASNSGSRMVHALRTGIIILMVPPLCICSILTIVAFRKRNAFRIPDENLPEEQ